MPDSHSPDHIEQSTTRFLQKEVSRRKFLQGTALLTALGLSSTVLAACGKGPGAEAIERHREEFQLGGQPEIYHGTLYINADANRRYTPAIQDDPDRPNFAYNLRDEHAVEVVENPIVIKDGQHAVPEYGKKGKWISYFSTVTNSMVWVYVGPETARTMITSPSDQTPQTYNLQQETKCTITKADLNARELYCAVNNQEIRVAQSQIVRPNQATR